MKTIVIKVLSLFVIAMVLISCDNQTTIQEYYVEKQESSDFLMLDIPASTLQFKEDSSEEVKEALSSVKKLNLLAFKLEDDNLEQYNIEKAKVKEILNHKNFEELVRMKRNSVNIVVKYIGEEETIDELIVFASDNKMGFALARVIGDDMRPENFLKVMNSLDNLDLNNPMFDEAKAVIESIE